MFIGTHRFETPNTKSFKQNTLTSAQRASTAEGAQRACTSWGIKTKDDEPQECKLVCRQYSEVLYKRAGRITTKDYS